MAVIPILIRLVVTGVLIVVIGVVCVFAIIALRGRLRIHNDSSQIVRIKNQGNVPSYYFLKVESPETGLKFQLSTNNIPLVAVTPAGVSHVSSQQKAPAVTAPASKGSKSSGGAVGQGRAAVSKIGAVASFMGALGSLLPGELGSSFRERSVEIREVQTNASDAVQAPVSVQRQIGELKNESSAFGGGGAVKQAPRALPQTREDASVAGKNGSVSAEQPAPGSRLAMNGSGQAYFARTAEIRPGTAETFTLNIGTNKPRYPKGSFLYTIWSEQVPLQPLSIEIPVARKDGMVHFENIEGWRYWLSPLASGMVVLLSFFLAIICLRIIW